ncbi:uncharacterized protein M421DRAFT_158060 [Didymella exigua CBS 183.55]|uniref:Uncharacterized protein n=1 Tax=Didymella exigua CBS 183.55 TaxID=1150837 RepID=A0A6A5RPR1_9PLEO|nr:uncharacterized protein M421DRAFT_158060 [Didymella exigua CBS 183.55]KAF1928296.1 hypothetical protein M421DRAFT_158060 [Didymella exigua CBS 183.55]
MRASAACHCAACQLAAHFDQDTSSPPTIRRRQMATARGKYQVLLVCMTLLHDCQSQMLGVAVISRLFLSRIPSAVVVSVAFPSVNLALSDLILRIYSTRLCSSRANAQLCSNKTLVKKALLSAIGRLPLTKAGRMQSAPLTIHTRALAAWPDLPLRLLPPPANTAGLGLEPARQDDKGWQFHM